MKHKLFKATSIHQDKNINVTVTCILKPSIINNMHADYYNFVYITALKYTEYNAAMIY